MADTQILLAFLATAAVFAYFPGPAMLYTAAQTVARGRGAGLFAALGIHIGCYVHVVAAAVGLSALFHAVPVLYVVMKLVGAAYLIWLGLSMIRRGQLGAAMPHPAQVSRRRAFAESIAVEVLNPKVALFFVAFLPQFVDPAGTLPVWAQILVLGTVVNMMFTSADLICVAMAGAVTERLGRSSRVQAATRRLGGGLLVGLGVHLGLQRST